jgi:excisionase family DNA binding protein
MAELLLTVAQAAKRMQLHPISVRKQLNDGRLRGIQRGGRGRWRIPESALLESAPTQATPSAQDVPSADELAALFAPPTAEEIQRRLASLAELGKNTPRRKGSPPLPADAIAQGYDERIADLMNDHR